MTPCFFASDLHGSTHRFERLFERIAHERPAAVFLGGDLLPPAFAGRGSPGSPSGGFLKEFLVSNLASLKKRLGQAYPRLFLILGNDDLREEERSFLAPESEGLWTYLHLERAELEGFQVVGYSFVPPTPFLWKDWERYDVSRFVPPGCVSPEEGWRTVPVDPHETRYATIKEDLDLLAGAEDLGRTVFLFHTPPHDTKLDRAALDGKMVDHVPLDLHVGSIAVRRFIETRQPFLTLHGHIHESPRLTGSWRDRIGRTHMFSGGHDGPELALIRFDLGDLEGATRTMI